MEEVVNSEQKLVGYFADRTEAGGENRHAEGTCCAGKHRAGVDDLSMRERAKNDSKMFLQLHKPPVLIDEVQYAPELFTYIKIHVDEHHNPGDFWLTGSQVFRLMKGVQESLAGRVALLHMSPLSQREMLGAECVPFTTNFDVLVEQSKLIQPVTTPELFARLGNGCMPGLVSGDFAGRDIFYSSYLSTYLERDVRDLHDRKIRSSKV